MEKEYTSFEVIELSEHEKIRLTSLSTKAG